MQGADGGERRRRTWSADQKQRIIAESFAPGASVAEVARRYGLNANMLFTWRRRERADVNDVGKTVSIVPMIPAPQSCPCCGSAKLSKLGEDITETLEVIPRQWKVIQTVRERFSCRECETITQPPAPFHVTPRGFAGPNLLAMVRFEKFGQHQPLNRQSERYAREGVDLSLSTLADQVGACAAALGPLHRLIERHVLSAERLHGDDTTVPILAKGKTETGRVWTYVRDDRPFGGKDPPAALFYASRDRRGEHPERHLTNWSGVLQADAFSGYARLYPPDRKPGPIVEALCWSHARRKFFELADIAANARRGKNAAPISPIALEAVKRIDAIFDIEREINGVTAEERLAARRSRSAPLVAALEEWTRSERAKLSRHNAVAKAIDYMLTRWPAFSRFLEDGRICLTNNAAERALRGLALGRKSWLFAGSDEGASYCSSRHPLISQRDFFGDCQTAVVATAERWLRAEGSRAPTPHGGLSRARPCTSGSRTALVRQSSGAQLTY